MEASGNSIRGGLWNRPGPRQYSKDTQDMLMCELMAFLSSRKGEEYVCMCVRRCFWVMLILSPGFQWWCRNPGLPTCRKDRSPTASEVGLRCVVGCVMYYFKNTNAHMLISPFSSEGTSLPLPFDSPSPAPPREPKPVQRRLSARPQRRSAEACRLGDGYTREKFCPGPTSRFLKPWEV